jgi:hypothetical protein
VAKLLRCSWEAVDHIVGRVVAEHIDDARLDGLYRIGVDEISYKRGHRYLTIVADHDTGRVVWVGKDRSQAAFNAFFDALGDGPSKWRRSAWTRRASTRPSPPNGSRARRSAWTRSTSSAGPGRSSRPPTDLRHPNFHSATAGPAAGTGAVPATRYAPARSALTSVTTRFLVRCAGTATGYGAPGN